MNKIKIISVLIHCLISTAVVAQFKLSGVVKSTSDSSRVIHCNIHLNKGHRITMTDSLGYFEFTDLPDGHYTLYASSLEFKHFHKSITVNGKDQHMNISLHPANNMLEEVVVEQKKADAGYMRSVESMGIYEGKKSEVIYPEKLVANLATNNARQVYARVAGLNIWENDGAGLQLSIGGRGLDPNRTSNFNVRQNGYDISADALGYPESYYTPPLEAIERIEIIRGAASLQYGTQFGGLLNFVLRKPVTDKKIQVTVRQTAGSFGFYNSFNSVSGTVGKLSYYTFFQYKRGDGWRPNSHFDNYNFYSNIGYKISEKTSVGMDATITDYLSQQPGGLTDKMFEDNPRQSNRERNWFKVKWNMLALHFNHKFNSSNEFNARLFGLSAFRYSLGFRPNRVATTDNNGERDLIKGDFSNWGAEVRHLKKYTLFNRRFVFLAGGRYYHGFNHSTQGQGSKGAGPDFNYIPENIMMNDYKFPNQNMSIFTENIINLTEKFSVTPGLRYEYIHTTAVGYYTHIDDDLAGNIIAINRGDEFRVSRRQFILGGVGLSYKPTSKINIYGNISQNYRSITFSDMQIVNPSFVIDPNLKDEKGYSLDAGIRSEQTQKVIYDLSLFYLNYNNRIGEVITTDDFGRVIRRRGNIGQAQIYGIESYVESDLFRLLKPGMEKWSGLIFINTAFIHSNYKKSALAGVAGNEVEYVPGINFKSGVRAGYKNLKAAFQYTALSDQFSDATNAVKEHESAVGGLIPTYSVMDFSLSYEYKKFKIEGSINNLTNKMYFTRRATGYPGPGILPSDGRSFYLTLQVKI